MNWRMKEFGVTVLPWETKIEDGIYVRYICPDPYGEGFICERITYKDGEVIDTASFLSMHETEETLNSYKIIKNE